MSTAASREFDNYVTSQRLTLQQAAALLEDPPAVLSDQQKRRLGSWVDKYQTTWRNKQKERYQAAAKLLEERRDQIEEDLETLAEMAADVRDDLDHGRVSAEEAEAQLKGIFKTIKQLRGRIAGTRSDEEQTWEMVNKNAAEYQREQLRRFPTLAETLPRLSSAYLNGQEDAEW